MNRLTRITDSMMEYQRFENEPLKFEYELIALTEIFVFLELQYQYALKENEQTIVFDRNKEIFFYFDRDKLMQIIYNIVSNFLKYAGKHTTLFISFSEKNTLYRIVFEDNGRGVSHEHIPFLKEKFYQADRVKTGDIQSRGIGVGLSIVSKILDACGGRWTIKSDKGKGFKVTIVLPKFV